MRKTKSILIFSLITAFGFLVFFLYSLSTQKHLVQKKFEQYINEQGTSTDNIESMKTLKDYKVGGYIITVVYKDDPEFTYQYTYLPSGQMICIIFDKYNVSTDTTNKKTKYKSLE